MVGSGAGRDGKSKFRPRPRLPNAFLTSVSAPTVYRPNLRHLVSEVPQFGSSRPLPNKLTRRKYNCYHVPDEITLHNNENHEKKRLFPTIWGCPVIQKPFHTKSRTSIVACVSPTFTPGFKTFRTSGSVHHVQKTLLGYLVWRSAACRSIANSCRIVTTPRKPVIHVDLHLTIFFCSFLVFYWTTPRPATV